MTIPRSEIIDESKPGVYHITACCVRRAYLCGKDHYSGIDYRRVWIEDRLRSLIDAFADRTIDRPIPTHTSPPSLVLACTINECPSPSQSYICPIPRS